MRKKQHPPLRARLEWRDSERDFATDTHRLLANDERRVTFLLHFLRKMAEDSADLEEVCSRCALQMERLPGIKIRVAPIRKPEHE